MTVFDKMDMFHKIALEEYALALINEEPADSDSIKKKAYERYERELWESKKK